jgi:hypothetical protein
MLQPGAKYIDTRLHNYDFWAADNACFAAKWDETKWFRWLETVPRDGCLFATAPDILADMPASYARSRPYLPRLRDMGFKAALVAQDGMETMIDEIDWSEVDWLFIGGTTEWKLTGGWEAAARAHTLGLPVHLGRVNSFRRLMAGASAAFESSDGTFLKHGCDILMPRVEWWLRRLNDHPQLLLPSTVD